MRRHLKRWLNDGELLKMGGSYEVSIVEVVEEQVRNRYTAQRELQPVIVFDDGWRLIPNIGMRRALVEMFGSETDDWVGRRVRVFRRRMVRESANGEMRERYEKAVECVDSDPRELTTTSRTEIEELTTADISWKRDR